MTDLNQPAGGTDFTGSAGTGGPGTDDGGKAE